MRRSTCRCVLFSEPNPLRLAAMERNSVKPKCGRGFIKRLGCYTKQEQESVECDEPGRSMRKSQHPLRDAMHLSRVPNYHRALPKKLKALVFFDRPDGMEELLTSMRIAG